MVTVESIRAQMNNLRAMIQEQEPHLPIDYPASMTATQARERERVYRSGNSVGRSLYDGFQVRNIFMDEASGVDSGVFSQGDMDTVARSAHLRQENPPHRREQIPSRIMAINWDNKWAIWTRCRLEAQTRIQDIEAYINQGARSFGVSVDRDCFDSMMYELLFVRSYAYRFRIMQANDCFNMIDRRWDSHCRYDGIDRFVTIDFRRE